MKPTSFRMLHSAARTIQQPKGWSMQLRATSSLIRSKINLAISFQQAHGLDSNLRRSICVRLLLFSLSGLHLDPGIRPYTRPEYPFPYAWVSILGSLCSIRKLAKSAQAVLDMQASRKQAPNEGGEMNEKLPVYSQKGLRSSFVPASFGVYLYVLVWNIN